VEWSFAILLGLTPPGYNMPPLRGWEGGDEKRPRSINLGLTPPGYNMPPLRGWNRAFRRLRSINLGLTPPDYNMPPLRGWEGGNAGAASDPGELSS
jgi:hypothetical protein